MNFDGHPLYEDSNELRMEHRGWGTRCFNHGKPEVMSFLISNAFFYFDKYHIDALRVDAVSAMIYLDYDRKDGEWEPNANGGRENLEAINFLKALNSNVQMTFPGVLMIAEESTAFPMITMPPDAGGLGFNFKWNMGWMNDTLSYFHTDPVFRAGIHNQLTFSMSYAFSENFILPISHDEVVHGKYSLISKMPGEYEEKFAGVRAFMVYMMTHPGKKLLFMGQEFGQFIEWNEKREIDWMLLDYEMHRKLQAYVKELNRFYLDTPAMWERDDSWEGFSWIDADNRNDNVFSYTRRDKKGGLLVIILNLSGQAYRNFDIGVPEEGEYLVMIDTDRKRHGGRGSRRKPVYKTKKADRNGQAQYIKLNMPALSAIILKKKEG
jgi:1,4-alpha-glucan branching enzyme